MSVALARVSKCEREGSASPSGLAIHIRGETASSRPCPDAGSRFIFGSVLVGCVTLPGCLKDGLHPFARYRPIAAANEELVWRVG